MVVEEAGASRAREPYRWPRLTADEEAQLIAAYAALTGRSVWPKVRPPLIVAQRRHGPDTIPLMQEFYEAGGADDLLRRMLTATPRHDPHPDFIAPASGFQAGDAPERATAEARSGRTRSATRPSPITSAVVARSAEPETSGRLNARTAGPGAPRHPQQKPTNAEWEAEELTDLEEELERQSALGPGTQASSSAAPRVEVKHGDQQLECDWGGNSSRILDSPSARAFQGR